jgi:hypothetical protein
VASSPKETWLLTRVAESIKLEDVYRGFVFDPESAGVSERDFGRSLHDFAQESRA